MCKKVLASIDKTGHPILVLTRSTGYELDEAYVNWKDEQLNGAHFASNRKIPLQIYIPSHPVSEYP